MNCSRATTEKKVKILVKLLPGADNKTITDLLRDEHPDWVIGDDYVRSVRKVWLENGRPDDYKVVLEKMKYLHKRKKEKEGDVTLFPVNPSQESKVEKSGDFTEREIAVLKKLIWLYDAIKSTE